MCACACLVCVGCGIECVLVRDVCVLCVWDRMCCVCGIECVLVRVSQATSLSPTHILSHTHNTHTSYSCFFPLFILLLIPHCRVISISEKPFFSKFLLEREFGFFFFLLFWDRKVRRALFCQIPSFFLVWCRQRPFDEIFFGIVGQPVRICWCFNAPLIMCAYILVIWSLRVSIQDWVAEACALGLVASESLVRASTQYTHIYSKVHQDCTWPRRRSESKASSKASWWTFGYIWVYWVDAVTRDLLERLGPRRITETQKWTASRSCAVHMRRRSEVRLLESETQKWIDDALESETQKWIQSVI